MFINDLFRYHPDDRKAIVLSNIKYVEWLRANPPKVPDPPKPHDFDQRTLCCTKCLIPKIDATYNKAECICA